MAHWKTQAWITSAVNDDTVHNALVLAESIRKTQTTRRISVITSMNVSMKNRCALRQVFDLVFLMDETFAPGGVAQGLLGDIQAKIYSFALILFEKCVFVSSNSLFLANADSLFETEDTFLARVHPNNGSIDTSLFMLKPDKSIWSSIWESVNWNDKKMTHMHLNLWLKNQTAALKMTTLPKKTISDFDLATGELTSGNAHARIVHLVGATQTSPTVTQLMGKLDDGKMGLEAHIVRDLWMELSRKVGTTSQDLMMSWREPVKRKYNNEPIAIVGMSCRYPGANTLEEFWNLLFSGEEGIRECPPFRWKKEHTVRVSQQDKKSQAGFLSTTVDEFDARFFGVSPKEAAYMDPQARLLHEVMWESLEDAGINPLSLYGSHTGIFTGSWMNDYKDIVQCSAEKDFFRTYMGNSIGAAAARLSFLLGLTGPSIATESGCSSAIVALDLAVKSLRCKETNLALAGGVNLLLHPFTSNMMEYVISPNGRCKTFDANADGFGRAEGCGVLVLKRLHDALEDRDHIWALIRGSAVSQEGVSRSLGTPTVHCEALAMQLALKDADVGPEQVSFVETHGTGTQVGDPMEVAAISKAYYSPKRKEPLVIGSVKTNVGHTESCSGITGVMKAVLAMQHDTIPKHKNLETLNPEVFLDSIPAIIPMENLPWPRMPGQSRLCGVSSFGITGTDGHVILEDAPDYEYPKFNLGLKRPTHIMTISGKTGEALEELLAEYENRFSEMDEKKENKSFADVAYSANVGRAGFPHRTFLVANNYQDAAKMIKENKFLQGEVKEENNSQICFLFTGQGSQYQGMAKMLYETSPIFRIYFDRCDRELRDKYNISICNILWDSDPKSKELSRTIYSQTSIFCVEYCLLKLWESWGIKPDFVLGHSLGEFCAAVAAEVLSFKDALKLVAERSRLIDNLPRGSMLVIKASKPEVEKWMKAAKVDLDFAAVNNPEQTVVAGDTKTVETFLAYLKGQGTKAIILEATHAFHSRHMDPMLEQYRKVAQSIKYQPGDRSIQYISGMEGRLIDDSSELGADYWVRHTREKVSFIDACAVLRDSGVQDFIEVGPQPVLSSFVMQNNEGTPLNCFPSMRRGTDDWETILTSLGKLYLLGYQVDWKGYDETYIRKKVSLPFHPFHRKSFWVDVSVDQAPIIHPLVGHPLKNASSLSIFQNDLTLKSVPYLKDHCIGNRVVFPGAGYIEMCLSAGYCVANGLTETLDPPNRAMRLENVRIEAPLELKEGKNCRLQVIVNLAESSNSTQDSDNQGFSVKVYHQNNLSSDSGKWVLHASSTYFPVASTKEPMKHLKLDRIREILSTVEPSTPEAFYKRIDDTGLRFGENFKSIKKYWAVQQTNCKKPVDELVVMLDLPRDSGKYLVHPLMLDAAFQTGILSRSQYEDSKLKVPVCVGQLTVFPQPETKKEGDSSFVYLHCWWQDENCVLLLTTSELEPLALMENSELIDTNVRTIESVLEQQSSTLPDAWEETWKTIPAPFASSVEKAVDLQTIFEQNGIFQPTPEEDWKLFRETKKMLYLFILNAFQELGWRPTLGEQINLQNFCTKLGIQQRFEKLVRFYLNVLQEQGGLLAENSGNSSLWTVVKLPPNNGLVAQEANQLCSYLKASKETKVAQIHENLAKNLSKMLKGEENSLAILFPQSADQQHLSADSYYQNHPGRQNTIRTGIAIGLPIFQQSFKLNGSDPKKIYRVLEVGSGTGSMSLELLRNVTSVWGDRVEFYFTDISQSFFLKAEKGLEEFKERVKYSVFNIEQSPLSQGIPLEYFDMICATDVIHATRNLKESLVHLRQTMKPGGVIFFTETVKPSTDITFVFGLLDGYWRFEDFDRRPNHCCVGEEVWREVLEESGFEGVKCVTSFADELGVITAQASGTIGLGDITVPRRAEVEEPRKEWVLFLDKENFGGMDKVARLLDSSGYKVTTVWQQGQIDAESEKEIERILGGDKLQGVIYGWGMNAMVRDQKMVALPFLHIAKFSAGLMKPPQLFVLTEGVHAVNEDGITGNPTAGTLWGMVKSLKNESFEMTLRIVDLEEEDKPEVKASQVLYELAMVKGTREHHRLQVVYRGGLRYEPRFVKANLVGGEQELKLPASTDRYHLRLPESRAIQDLEFESMDVEPVGDSEIEVRVKAFALNFRDIFAILKPSKEFESLNGVGLDFAGVVVKAGKESRWKVGHRVFGCNYKDDQLPSHLVVDYRSVTGIPDQMTYWEAATLPAVFSTAYHCLITVARMTKGDKVLIHTGSGGVGLAAIQLAKLVGAEIITTAGNKRKRAYLKSLGIQHVFHSRDTSYEQDILRVTNGQGVDIVLNSITGPGIKEATLRATAKNGRFVEMSKLSTWSNEEVLVLRPDVDYNIVDLMKVDQETSVHLLERMHHYLSTGQMKAIPFVKFDALRIRQALQYFQKARHIGKVVVAMPEVSTQQGQYATEVPLFNGESTYLITGGLGGIGFEVCKWMLAHGATDLVLTGRSAPKPEVDKEIQSLREKGFNIMIRLGDVGNYEHCKAMIQEIEQSMKPLRGVMHCAGVLRDGLYANQTWSNFEATFTPKVIGTWHLHNLTRALTLEHFVVYSSLTALIGTPAQPNHSGANCFEDAFIHYRHSLGLPGTTINWGQWAQVGCAKEAYLSGVLPVSVARMLNGLEVTLRSDKRQVCFSEFDSFANFSIFCPSFKAYLDERLWKQQTSGSGKGAGNGINAEEFWKEMDGLDSRTEKELLLCSHLKQILRQALRLESDEPLSDDANLQELGVDSLMSIELKNSIQSLLGSRLTVTSNLLKNCNTIRQLANAVVGSIVEDEDGQDTVELALEPLPSDELLQLLKTDAILPENIDIEPETMPAVKMNQIKTLLVTGATGQVGPYLLAELERSYPGIEKILCLVRGDKQRLERTLKGLQINLEKVEAIVGDVTQEQLGLKSEEYDNLCKVVDGVIHCAAKTNPSEHLRKHPNNSGGKPRTDCRSVNVEGTLNTLRFCCRGKVKHLFYPSTLACGIFSESLSDQLSDHWPEEDTLETLVNIKAPGLQSSKFISEMLLRQATERGVPAKVFRFPWIAGERQTGRLQVLNNLYILRWLSFLKLGAMPELVIPANVLPVDLCAELGLKLFMNDNCPCEIFNVGHPQPQMELEFAQVAKEVLDKQVEILDWKLFLEKVEQQNLANSENDEMGLGNIFRDQKMVSYYLKDGAGLVTGYLKNPQGFFLNEKVSKWIPNYGQEFPQTMDTLRKDLSYLKSTGILSKFGV